MKPVVQVERGTVGKRLTQKQLVIAAKCPAVAVRLLAMRVRNTSNDVSIGESLTIKEAYGWRNASDGTS